MASISRITFAISTVIFIVLIAIGLLFFPHFRSRIISFSKNTDQVKQYQVKKSIEAIKNGGYFGTGIGNGVYKYQLPDGHTDYIFGVICEEFGMIFAVFVIWLYMKLIMSFIKFGIKGDSALSSNIFFGFCFMLFSEVFINISVSLNLIPSKGMALPLISYGGSSAISTYISLGFLLAFSRKKYGFIRIYS
jgi:cell division protein FtsW